MALEGNVPYGSDEGRFRGRALLDLGTVPGGYAWAFPKGDHVNVGVGGWEGEGPRLREHLARACAGYGLPQDRLRALRGYRLPMRGPGERPVRGRALAVGDAAAVVRGVPGVGDLAHPIGEIAEKLAIVEPVCSGVRARDENAADECSFSDVASRAAFQIGYDAMFNIIKEFYPDIKRKLSKKSH